MLEKLLLLERSTSAGGKRINMWLRGCGQEEKPRRAERRFQGPALIGCMCVRQAASVVSDSVLPYGPQTTRLLCPWDSPGKNTGVGCHALLQGVFPTQGLNMCLLPLLYWQARFTT